VTGGSSQTNSVISTGVAYAGALVGRKRLAIATRNAVLDGFLADYACRVLLGTEGGVPYQLELTCVEEEGRCRLVCQEVNTASTETEGAGTTLAYLIEHAPDRRKRVYSQVAARLIIELQWDECATFTVYSAPSKLNEASGRTTFAGYPKYRQKTNYDLLLKRLKSEAVPDVLEAELLAKLQKAPG
jgi:hypothetical protein